VPRFLRQLNEQLLVGLSRWRYQLEKGQPHLKLFVVLLIAMVGLIVGGGLVLYVAGASPSPLDAMWSVFLHLSDPGYLGEDHGPVELVVGLFMTLAGIVVFMSGVIAIVTSLLSTQLARLAEGGHDVAFRDHIVIIGWSEKIFALVFELLLADSGNDIAILGPRDKASADHDLERRVFAPFDRRRAAIQRARLRDDPRRSVVYRQGVALVEADLDRVGSARASRFILLAPDERRGEAGDVEMLRAYLTVRGHRLRRGGGLGEHDCRRGRTRFSCVVEIAENRLREHVFLAAGLDPRADAWVAEAMRLDPQRHEAVPDLPAPTMGPRDDLTLINGDELITRALVQCAVQPRISGVYDVLLSFEGRDLTVVSSVELQQGLVLEGRGRGSRAEALEVWESLCARIEGGELPDSEVFTELGRRLSNIRVIGALEPLDEGGHRLLFEASSWRARVPTGDPARDRAEGRLPLIVLGDSVRTDRGAHRQPIALREVPLPPPAPRQATVEPVPTRRHYRVLILGSNRRLSVLIEQFASFTEQYEYLDLALTIVDPELPPDLSSTLGRAAARAFCDNAIQARREDFSEWEVMQRLLADAPAQGPAFDSVVLLSEDWTEDDVGVDARVVLGLVMLRAFRSDPRTAHRLEGTSVVAEILDPDNRALFEHEQWVTDVIVTNQYVSRFAAQVAHDVRVEELYRELFDFGGSEIYVRAPAAYLPDAGGRFLDVIAEAGRREEVALGYLQEVSPGVVHPVIGPDPGDMVLSPVGVVVVAER